jgi:putative membrane protein
MTAGTMSAAQATDGTRQPEADAGHNYPMPTPHAATAEQFYAGVIGPATLSAVASRIAVDKATASDTMQFANFELREAIAVTAIIGNIGTPTPALDATGQALIEQLRTTPAGAGFDMAYVTAELANHEFLRDLAESYLKNATGPADAAEMQGRHLATLALTAFKEHVVLSKNIVHAIAM